MIDSAERPGPRWPKVGLAALVGHMVLMGASGFTEGISFVSVLSALLGVVAIISCSWWVVLQADRAIEERGSRPISRAIFRSLIGLVLIGVTPTVFHGLKGAPLPLIGRILELATVGLSIVVLSGLLLGALGAADLVYWLTSRFKRIATRLMLLLLLTAIGTFLWLGFVGMQAHTILLWAIEQGHLEGLFEGLELLTRSADVYLGGLAGAMSMELPFLLLLAWRFGQNFTGDMRTLHSGFQRVAEGNYDEPVPVSSQDEVGEMMRGFNHMLEAARERHFLETAFGRYVSPVVLERMREAGQDTEGGMVAMLAGERRVASVMFSDIRGFTAMSANLAPEEVISVLNRYMSLMINVISRYDGYINKFVGDAILVVFNAPIDQPDHALRALACSQAMQEALGEANDEELFGTGERMEMGIGVNTGPLVAGNLGNEQQVEFTVLGDTVNVASRACSHAGAKEVALTRPVLEAIASASAPAAAGGASFEVPVESHGQVPVKGKGTIEFLAITCDAATLDAGLTPPPG